VEVHEIPLSRLRADRDPRLAWQLVAGFKPQVATLRTAFDELGIDLVVVGGLVNPHSAVAARLNKLPVVWQILDTRTPRVLRWAMMPVVRRLADAVMYAGGSVRSLHGLRHVAHLPNYVIPPAVDTARFVPSERARISSRERVGIPHDAQVVGTVSNINPMKGVEYFVRAATLIHSRLPKTYFLVLGEQSGRHTRYHEEIKEECRRSGIPKERFIFAGASEHVEEWYPAMDVKLITSVPNSEGAPTTAMEAMACGVPVVATDVGAVSEVVVDRATGFTVPPLDPAALADATVRVLTDAPLADRMSRAAQDRAKAVFDIQVAVKRYLVAFEAAKRHHEERDQ